MREVKYLAWSNKYKKMFRVSEISFDRDGYVHGLVDSETVDEHQPTQNEFETNPYVLIGRVDFVKSHDGRVAGLAQNPDDEPFILLQYTGLKDKNGKEIYEGDILEEIGTDVYRYVVHWNVTNATYDFVDIITDETFHGNDIHFEKSEVIGNIYENPDMSIRKVTTDARRSQTNTNADS